jgi:adenosylcobinamide-phosphate synthase
MAQDVTAVLAPSAPWLAFAIALDLAIGDPVYAWHPVRVIGRALTTIERALRRHGAEGYGGGVALFLTLSSLAIASASALVIGAQWFSPYWGTVAHVLLTYALLALGDLARHVWKIERAIRNGDLAGARAGVGELVGRDTDRMDEGACRRAAVESLTENLTDGFVSPVCWYVAGGVPGLVLFKVVSTMDSMVGYKTPMYLRFGWCGARLDDVMNYLPARLTWLVIVMVAAILPTFSARKAWLVGLAQHALLLSPNSGWSEAGAAGALQRRLAGPIWLRGRLVTDTWIGDPADPPMGSADDVSRALLIVLVSGLVIGALAVLVVLTVSTQWLEWES